MKEKLLNTPNTWMPLVLRVTLGLVVFAHGAQKLFGFFGGYGFAGTMSYFTETVGLPWILGVFIILLESVGALALVAGLGTRIIALCFTFLAIGIVFSSHIQHGFFMNWFGKQGGEGYEYFILWIGISSALFISGGGKFSLDKVLVRERIQALQHA